MKYKLLQKLTSIFSPSSFRCLQCGCDMFDDTAFCEHCKQQVVFNNGKTCLYCGVAIDGAEDYCGTCVAEKNYFDRAYSAFSYEGAVKSAILGMKFRNNGSNAAVFARYLVYLARKNDLHYDIVTFVPMSPLSVKQRGYNQSELLACGFCDLTEENNKLCATLAKVKETVKQETLGKKERKKNLVGCFAVTADVKGKRVLLIDDVKTTGATLNECAKALKRKGAVSVIGLTVASRKENFVYEIDEEYL